MMTLEILGEPAPVKYVSLTPEKVKKSSSRMCCGAKSLVNTCWPLGARKPANDSVVTKETLTWRIERT